MAKQTPVQRPVAFKLSPTMLKVLETLSQLAFEDMLVRLLWHERNDPYVADFLEAALAWQNEDYPTEAHVTKKEFDSIRPSRLEMLMRAEVDR